jgi:hypothetical protein
MNGIAPFTDTGIGSIAALAAFFRSDTSHGGFEIQMLPSPKWPSQSRTWPKAAISQSDE